MADRTTAKEVKIDLDGFKGGVDRQFSWVVRWIAGLYLVGGAIVGGGFLIRSDLGGVQKEIATNSAEITGLRRDIEGVQKRLDAFGKGITDFDSRLGKIGSAQDDIVSAQREAVTALRRIERRFPELSPVDTLSLDPKDRQIIRDFFKLVPGKSKSAQVNIGETVKDAIPVPDDLATNVPRLRGLLYARDVESGAVVFVNITGRAIGIVEP